MQTGDMEKLLAEGRAAKKIFQYREAVRYYTRVLEIDPECAAARRERAEIFRRTLQYYEAISDYTWLIERDGTDTQALFERAGLYRYSGRHEEELADLNRLLEIAPDNPEYIGKRGEHNMFGGNYEEALADFRRAFELEPENGWHLVNIADNYERQGMLREALTAFEQAAAIDGRYHCKYPMAQLYTKLGMPDKAMNELVLEYTERDDWAVEENYPSFHYADLVRVAREDDIASSVAHITELAGFGFYLDICAVTSEDYDPLPYTVVRPTLIPEGRSVLFLDRGHESRTNRRLIRKYGSRLDLRFDTDFDEAVAACVRIHGDGIITPTFVHCFRALRERTAGEPPQPRKILRTVSCSLYLDGRLVAADLGIIAGRAYTSYTGCHTEPDMGGIHLALMLRMFREAGFMVWDFGPCQMGYKIRLGATDITHEDYIDQINYINNLPYDP